MKKLSNFINGKSVESQSGETTTLVNPATGQPFATAPNSNAADIDAAYKAASDAFPDWRDSTPSQRQRALLKIADAIEERAEGVNWWTPRRGASRPPNISPQAWCMMSSVLRGRNRGRNTIAVGPIFSRPVCPG